MFKLACPKSYSYAYDDATSTFTCVGGDYTVTFCPDSTTSQKSSSPDPATTSNYPPPRPPPAPTTTTTTTTGGGGQGVMLEDNSWLASLATGDASHLTVTRPLHQQISSSVAATSACVLLVLQVL
ncbi:uncharacterized protein A4U43_C04F8060 [Asparagus officinalis]|uniref:Thaumatin-like protein n=1 Tax=Asparagus officinalis TaxID=4686 RepID=A0A5P1F424_ASPOF|nr:uncharacterized protein A4U43_C04F8060 [Asparagus officinalis]